MRIVLDLQGAQGESRYRGIGRYTLSLAQAILRRRGDHEVILALSDLLPETIEPIRGRFDGLISQDLIKVWQGPGPVRFREPANAWRRRTSTRIRDAFITSLRPDLVHVSDNFGGYVDDVIPPGRELDPSSLMTISLYDLIPLLHPEEYLAPDRRYEQHYATALKQAKSADALLAISESSALEARQLLGVDATVVNISASCDERFTKVDLSPDAEAAVRARFHLERSFVLHTGGADARKNLRRLIHAFALLPSGLRGKTQLVLAGKLDASHIASLRAEASRHGLEDHELRFTGYVTDDDLVLLYNLCATFVLPSIHEGFGLPALEAMACGAPVIASNLTSLPEVVGWPDAMFDPFNAHAMSAKLARALSDQAFRSELVVRGRERAAQFSWDECASRAVDSFERLLRGRAHPVALTKSVPEDEINRLVSAIRASPGQPDVQDLVITARSVSANHPVKGEARLLVDVSALIETDLRSGIQRVVRSMLTQLPARLPSRIRIEVVYANAERPGYRVARYQQAPADGRSLEPNNEVLEPRVGDMFLGLDLNHDVVTAQSKFFAELRRLGIPVHFVVYDLLPVLLPQRFPSDMEAKSAEWLSVVAASDAAHCISRAVADEFCGWVRKNGRRRYRPLRIGWFHLGADFEHSEPSAGLPAGAEDLLRNFEARPTFLHVGTLEPRKGHDQALRAFEQLWSDGVDANLVFVGKQGWQVDAFTREIRGHPEAGIRLFWLETISDEFLTQIYKTASCLISPSEGEGFGLPLIEAARHGLSIITRDLPVFREVVGTHAVYFVGAAPADLASAIRTWLDLWHVREHPQSSRINVLTWAQSATQLVETVLGEREYLSLPPTPSSTVTEPDAFEKCAPTFANSGVG